MGLGVIMATLKELLGEAYKDGITVEEIETAIANKKLVDISTGAYVSISKYQALETERNDFKEKYTSTLTEQQKAEQLALEKEKEYEAIKRENTLHKHKEKLSKTIKDENVLNEIATLYADGNLESAFEKQNAYFEAQRTEIEKKVKADLMAQNPQGNPQEGNVGTITAEQFAKMDYKARVELYNSNRDLYNQLSSNET